MKIIHTFTQVKSRIESNKILFQGVYFMNRNFNVIFIFSFSCLVLSICQSHAARITERTDFIIDNKKIHFEFKTNCAYHSEISNNLNFKQSTFTFKQDDNSTVEADAPLNIVVTNNSTKVQCLPLSKNSKAPRFESCYSPVIPGTLQSKVIIIPKASFQREYDWFWQKWATYRVSLEIYQIDAKGDLNSDVLATLNFDCEAKNYN